MKNTQENNTQEVKEQASKDTAEQKNVVVDQSAQQIVDDKQKEEQSQEKQLDVKEDIKEPSKTRRAASVAISIGIAALAVGAALFLPAGLPMVFGLVGLATAAPFAQKPISRFADRIAGIKPEQREVLSKRHAKEKGHSQEKSSDKERSDAKGNEKDKKPDIAEEETKKKGLGERALGVGIKVAGVAAVSTLAIAGGMLFGLPGIIIAAAVTIAYKKEMQDKVIEHGDKIASRIIHGPKKGTGEDKEKDIEPKEKQSAVRKTASTLLTAGLITGLVAASILFFPVGAPAIVAAVAVGAAIPLAKPYMQKATDKLCGVKHHTKTTQGKDVKQDANKELAAQDKENTKGRGEKALGLGLKTIGMIAVTAALVIAGTTLLGPVGLIVASLAAVVLKEPMEEGVQKLGDKLASGIVKSLKKTEEVAKAVEKDIEKLVDKVEGKTDKHEVEQKKTTEVKQPEVKQQTNEVDPKGQQKQTSIKQETTIEVNQPEVKQEEGQKQAPVVKQESQTIIGITKQTSQYNMALLNNKEHLDNQHQHQGNNNKIQEIIKNHDQQKNNHTTKVEQQKQEANSNNISQYNK